MKLCFAGVFCTQCQCSLSISVTCLSVWLIIVNYFENKQKTHLNEQIVFRVMFSYEVELGTSWVFSFVCEIRACLSTFRLHMNKD